MACASQANGGRLLSARNPSHARSAPPWRSWDLLPSRPASGGALRPQHFSGLGAQIGSFGLWLVETGGGARASWKSLSGPFPGGGQGEGDRPAPAPRVPAGRGGARGGEQGAAIGTGPGAARAPSESSPPFQAARERRSAGCPAVSRGRDRRGPVWRAFGGPPERTPGCRRGRLGLHVALLSVAALDRSLGARGGAHGRLRPGAESSGGAGWGASPLPSADLPAQILARARLAIIRSQQPPSPKKNLRGEGPWHPPPGQPRKKSWLKGGLFGDGWMGRWGWLRAGAGGLPRWVGLSQRLLRPPKRA